MAFPDRKLYPTPTPQWYSLQFSVAKLLSIRSRSANRNGRWSTRALPENIADMNTQALTLSERGDADWVTDDVPSITGRPAGTFELFVLDHAKAFS